MTTSPSLSRRAAVSLVSAAARASIAPKLLRSAALAPVALKSRGFERAWSALAARMDSPSELIETNAGISDKLRLLVPASKLSLVLGRPDNYPAERATHALALLLSRRSSSFVDVGANDGVFTFAIASQDPACPIHAFEPDPELFARLSDNLTRNHIRAQLHQKAVAGATGEVSFYRNLTDDFSGSLSSYFADQHETVRIEVPAVSLADYLEEQAIARACVKVDVEGAGSQVWDGTRRAHDRIDWLIMEILEPEVRAELPKRIISDTGWSAYYIRDYELVPSLDGSFEYKAPFYNWLFCPQAPDALARVLAGSAFRVVAPHRSMAA